MSFSVQSGSQILQNGNISAIKSAIKVQEQEMADILKGMEENDFKNLGSSADSSKNMISGLGINLDIKS